MRQCQEHSGLLSLGAGCGAELTFVAAGPDAPQALRAIERLFERDLDED